MLFYDGVCPLNCVEFPLLRGRPRCRSWSRNLDGCGCWSIWVCSQPGKAARFVKTTGTKRVFDQATFERALLLAGWKGYITNIPKTVMDAQEIVGSYTELWHVEQSFRMSKTDLQARPIFHRERDAVEAHLTVVFTALAINRYLYAATGTTLKKLVQTLRPLRDVTIKISGQQITGTLYGSSCLPQGPRLKG